MKHRHTASFQSRNNKGPSETEADLSQENQHLQSLLRQIEIAKREWEKTMDCVGDMVILTNSEGVIKRVNRAVITFTGKSYKEVLGMTWEDLIIEHELQAMSLYAGATELFHAPSGRWFGLNAYPFEDSELGFAGNVLTIHETTEIKHITEKLEKTNKRIDRSRNKLRDALIEICALMDHVIEKKDDRIRFSNPHLAKCYELRNCKKKTCDCYGKDGMRCWQVEGTDCNGKGQEKFSQKYKYCISCEVYKKATNDPMYQIGEHFNNLMHVLELKNK